MPNLNDDFSKLFASRKVACAGFAWYEAADYPEILRMMADRKRLPATHAEWLAKAEKQEQSIKNQGTRVIRAIIKPNDFRIWCAKRGHNIDAKGRMAFANEQAARDAGLI